MAVKKIKSVATKSTVKRNSTKKSVAKKNTATVKSTFSNAISKIGGLANTFGKNFIASGVSQYLKNAPQQYNQQYNQNQQSQSAISKGPEIYKEDSQNKTTEINNDKDYLKDYMSTIDSEFQARKAAAMARIERARDGSLSNLENERAGINPRYTSLKAETGANSQRNARNFSEFMANVGATNSGANLQGDIARQVAEQQAITGYNQAQAEDLANIDRKKTEVLNAAEYDKQAAESDIESDKISAVMDANEKADSLKAQEEANKLEVIKYNDDKAFKEANLIGLYNGEKTLAKQKQESQDKINASNEKIKKEELKLKKAKTKADIKKINDSIKNEKKKRDIELTKLALQKGLVNSQINRNNASTYRSYAGTQTKGGSSKTIGSSRIPRATEIENTVKAYVKKGEFDKAQIYFDRNAAVYKRSTSTNSFKALEDKLRGAKSAYAREAFRRVSSSLFKRK